MVEKMTESALKSLSSPESFARGHELYLSDAVFDTFRQGDLLTGKCEGSSAPFYQLSVQLDEGGIQEAPALVRMTGVVTASISLP